MNKTNGQLTILRYNLEEEYRAVEDIIRKNGFDGIYPPGFLLELVVSCYGGEQVPFFKEFEEIFGEKFISVVDSFKVELGPSIWETADLPGLYQDLVMDLYPRIVEKLRPFSNGFYDDQHVEVDSSTPRYTLIYLELKDEEIKLDHSSLEAIWSSERYQSSI